MKRIWMWVAIAATMLLTACGRIETGNVGVRTDFNGEVNAKIEQPGFYTAIFGHVSEYSAKEIPVVLDDMKPKAHDNLSLAELDMTVYYSTDASKVRDLVVKRAGSSINNGKGLWLPAYNLVKGISESEIADAVSKMDSLVIHTKRDTLASEVQKAVQRKLDESDPGAFKITRVVVRQVKTDETIEQSIRNVVAKEKELEAAKLNVAVAEANARATQQTAQTLTPSFLQHEYNQVLKAAFESGKVGTVIMDGSASGKMLNIQR